MAATEKTATTAKRQASTPRRRARKRTVKHTVRFRITNLEQLRHELEATAAKIHRGIELALSAYKTLGVLDVAVRGFGDTIVLGPGRQRLRRRRMR